MEIHKYISSGYDSNVYLILDKEAVVIDTGTGQGAHFKKLAGGIEKICDLQKIAKIILTHCHFDHCGGAEKLRNLTKADVLIHELDFNAIRIGDNVITGARLFGGSQEPLEVKKIGEKIEVGNIKLKVIHTPGHTKGSVSLYDNKNKSLFSGDTVFADGATGRWDLPTGSYEALLSSVKKISLLEVENLYPGHGRFVEGNGKEHIKLALEFLEGF
ncbi:MAG: MBL fold metallo-hydrolase [Candidatus Thermoplasmatota archaeon]|nr:MBL fold metallo-hydrolase [Candidatus Thermoplasmatota archaeon]